MLLLKHTNFRGGVSAAQASECRASTSRWQQRHLRSMPKTVELNLEESLPKEEFVDAQTQCSDGSGLAPMTPLARRISDTEDIRVGLTRRVSQASETYHPSIVVFSGGTAFNGVAGHLRHLTTKVTHVLPVSDDGGSTAEIVRVLGGPAVGDIRSRCLRLADASDEEGSETTAGAQAVCG